MKDAEKLLVRCERMDSKKAPWLPYWQELSEILLPEQAFFSGSSGDAGQSQVSELYDGTPRLAASQLVTTIDGLLKDKTRQWFWITTDDEVLNDDDEVKGWLEDSERRLWAAIYRNRANFIESSVQCDESLVVIGTGCLWNAENSKGNGLNFEAIHMNSASIQEDADGVVNGITITLMRKPAEAIAEFGEDNVHPEIIKKARDERARHVELPFKRLVLPKEDRDMWKVATGYHDYACVIIDVTHKHIVKTSGYYEFPASVPRWTRSPGQLYGRSPGMLALPDAKTLQAMGKTLLIAGQKAVDPPMWVLNEAALSPVRTFPGGHTIIDAQTAKDAGGTPMGVLETGKNLALGREMQEDYRRNVEAAFFKNIFSINVEGRQMTATEIIERKEEFTRTIGPIFGRLEVSYISHIVERSFKIMARNGGFAPLPEALAESEAKPKFTFLSPVQQVRKQIEMAGFARGLELMTPMLEQDPSLLKLINAEKIIRDMPEWAGIPQEYIRTMDEMEQIRNAEQQQAELQQALQVAQTGAPALKQLADANSSLAA